MASPFPSSAATSQSPSGFQPPATSVTSPTGCDVIFEHSRALLLNQPDFIFRKLPLLACFVTLNYSSFRRGRRDIRSPLPLSFKNFRMDEWMSRSPCGRQRWPRIGDRYELSDMFVSGSPINGGHDLAEAVAKFYLHRPLFTEKLNIKIGIFKINGYSPHPPPTPRGRGDRAASGLRRPRGDVGGSLAGTPRPGAGRGVGRAVAALRAGRGRWRCDSGGGG